MPDLTFTVSTAFLTRARTVIVAEQPNLEGQPNTVLNEAVRKQGRQMFINWLVSGERMIAARTAQNSVALPTDADIT